MCCPGCLLRMTIFMLAMESAGCRGLTTESLSGDCPLSEGSFFPRWCKLPRDNFHSMTGPLWRDKDLISSPKDNSGDCPCSRVLCVIGWGLCCHCVAVQFLCAQLCCLCFVTSAAPESTPMGLPANLHVGVCDLIRFPQRYILHKGRDCVLSFLSIRTRVFARFFQRCCGYELEEFGKPSLDLRSRT